MIMSNSLAPIVLTVYKRPWHTEQTLEALQLNALADQSTLYIYCDGPKYLALEEDLENIEKVRQIAKSKQWCKEVHVIESEVNLGLVQSFIKAVTEAVNKYGKVIVLEDDQRTSVGFLKYMNEALVLYEKDEKVMHVSGYMYPAEFTTQQSTFFLNVQSCPGWGTWKRAWDLYNHDAIDHYNYFSNDKRLIKAFDMGGYAGWFKQLERNTHLPGFSFAVRWYASCFRAGGLSLFPARSLVQNIGLDGTGEHCAPTNMYDVIPIDHLEIYRVPIVEDKNIRNSIGLYYKKHHSIPNSLKFKNTANDIKGKLRGLLRWPIKRLFPELNSIAQNYPPSILKNVNISKKSKVYPPYHIWNSSVGNYSYIAHNSWLSQVEIGKFCSIGPNFRCGWGIHPIEGISTSPMFYSTQAQNGATLSSTNKVQERKKITIGNDVFIGMNVIVLDGVSIGDGAVIGAGCVVSKDVPPYAVVVGSPMQILRYRFDEATRERLLSINWWEWPEEKLSLVEKYFFEIEKFLNNFQD